MRFLVLVCDSVSGAVREQLTCYGTATLAQLVTDIASRGLVGLELSILLLEEES